MKFIALSQRMLEMPSKFRDGEEIIPGNAADLIRPGARAHDGVAHMDVDRPLPRVSSFSHGFGGSNANKIERMCKQLMSSPHRFLGESETLIDIAMLPEAVGNKRPRGDTLQRSAKKRKSLTSKKISPSEEAQNLFGPLDRTPDVFSPREPFSPKGTKLRSKAPPLKSKSDAQSGSTMKKKSLEEKLKDVVVPSPLRSAPALRSQKPESDTGATSARGSEDDKRRRRRERRTERPDRDSSREGRTEKVERDSREKGSSAEKRSRDRTVDRSDREKSRDSRDDRRERDVRNRESPSERRRRERRAERSEREVSRERGDSSKERRSEKYSKYEPDEDESPFSRRKRDRRSERDSSRERRARSERDLSREPRGRAERDSSKERRSLSGREASKDRRGRTERDSSRERRRRLERSPSRERRSRSEQGPPKERRGRSERESSRERHGRSEGSSSRERRGRSERDASRERRGRSERDLSRERRGRSERSSSRERRVRSERDVSRERRARPERSSSRERRARSERESSGDRRGRSERSSSRERRSRSDHETSRELRRRKSDVDPRGTESPTEKRERRGDRYEKESKMRRSDKSDKDARDNDSPSTRRRKERRSSRTERDSSIERRAEKTAHNDGDTKSVRARSDEKSAKDSRKKETASVKVPHSAPARKEKESTGNGRNSTKSKSIGSAPNGREGIRSKPAPAVSHPPPLVSAPAPIPLSKPGPIQFRSAAAPTGLTSRPRQFISKPLPNGNGVGSSTQTSNMVLAKPKTPSDYHKEYAAIKELAQKEWEQKKYDEYEKHALEATKICFEWALCRERDFRRREKEIRKDAKKMETEMSNLRKHYNWITRTIARNHIQQLVSVNRMKGADTLKRITNKSYLRMSMLAAQCNGSSTFQTLTGVLERTMKASSSKDGNVNQDALLTDREARSLHKVVKEYANVMEIYNRVVADTGTGVQEPGTECTIQ